MKTYLIGAFGLITLAGLCSGQPAGSGSYGPNKQLDAVRKQIEEFQKKEQALREELRKQEQELDRQKQELEKKRVELVRKAEEEERKHHFARMEIQGRLSKTPSRSPENAKDVWRIQFGGLSATLDFAGNKELLAAAEQRVGQRVLVKGNLVTARSEQGHYYYYHGLESYKVTVECLSGCEK